MPISSTWTTPAALDRAIGDLLTETIWDQTVSNEYYLWDSLHNAARPVNIRTGATSLYVNDTSNATSALGLTINQGGADDEIVSLKSSDVAHGVTNLTETDSFATLGKLGTDGGLRLQALGGAASNTALLITAVGTAVGDTAKSTSATGVVRIDAERSSGVTVQQLAANGNLFCVTSQGLARFIVDVEGDVHADAGSATANSGTGYVVYDGYEDAELCRALEVERGGPGLVRDRFDALLRYGRRQLEAAGIATFNDGPGGDGSVFVNYSALARLHSGAVWQLHTRLAEALERVDALTARLAALEGPPEPVGPA